MASSMNRISGLLPAMIRRPVLAAFLTALAVRVVVAVAITIGWGGSLFLDDRAYSRLADAAADGRLHQLGAYPQLLYERTGTLLVPITALYELLGVVKLSGQLYVALLGAATAALVTRLALEVVDRRFALLAGLIVALLPSQILWSSLILKDAAVWATVSGLAVVVAVAGRTSGHRLVPLAAAAAALLALLGFLRLHSLEVACVAVVLATLASRPSQRLLRVSGAVALLVCIPLAFGMGVAGEPFVRGAPNLATQRARNAEHAQSAVVAAAVPSSADDTKSGLVDVSYLPKGLTVIALRPWPWEPSGSLGVTLARLETLVWYPLLVLAAAGLTTAWRHRRALAFPLLYAGTMFVIYGLVEGNLGTAYRHRGEAVWAVALLAALGVERIVAARRRPRAPELDVGEREAPAALDRSAHASTRTAESSTAT
jgi:hypothetical protein